MLKAIGLGICLCGVWMINVAFVAWLVLMFATP